MVVLFAEEMCVHHFVPLEPEGRGDFSVGVVVVCVEIGAVKLHECV